MAGLVLAHIEGAGEGVLGAEDEGAQQAEQDGYQSAGANRGDDPLHGTQTSVSAQPRTWGGAAEKEGRGSSRLQTLKQRRKQITR